MIETVESRVGSKGELFPPKEIREKLGLKPNTRILYRISEGKLVVEPVPDLEELMSREPITVISIDEFRKERTELSRQVER